MNHQQCKYQLYEKEEKIPKKNRVKKKEMKKMERCEMLCSVLVYAREWETKKKINTNVKYRKKKEFQAFPIARSSLKSFPVRLSMKIF